MFLFAGAFPIQAETVDMERDGSLRIVIHDGEGNPVPGGTLSWFYAGKIVNDQEGPRFELSESFKDSGADLSDPQDRHLIAYLEDYALENNLQRGTVAVPENAELYFPDVPTGLYLVIQEKAAPGYKPMSSFLISVPNYVDGEYVYDVSAYPKSDPEKLPSENPETPENPKEKPGTTGNSHTSAALNPVFWIGLMLAAAAASILLIRHESRRKQ